MINLTRIGGLSFVKQTNDKAPEKYGLWAFIDPWFEMFFVGCTNAEGILTPKQMGENKSRACQYKQGIEKKRRFQYNGELWTALDDVPAKQTIGMYHLCDSSVLHKRSQQIWAEIFAESKANNLNYKPEKYGTADIFEVFVPRGKGVII